jgi:hypothetical protein
MQYKIIKNSDTSIVEGWVQTHLDDGWELHGDLKVVLGMAMLQYIQVVVKRSEYSGVTWVDANGIKWQKVRE